MDENLDLTTNNDKDETNSAVDAYIYGNTLLGKTKSGREDGTKDVTSMPTLGNTVHS